jgi:prepilin-type N-terminal cleavage/methylation domain-containing protein
MSGSITTPRAGNRRTDRARGFTLVELLLAIVVAAFVAIAGVVVFSGQNRASSQQRRQVDSQQNARAAMDVLVREIRQAGADVDKFHKQTTLVDCGPYQVVFNADVRGGVGGDEAMQATVAVPLSDGTAYSPGDFLEENLENLTRFNNGAETIRLTLDATGDGHVTAADSCTDTSIPGDFRLVRQVDGAEAETVAYGVRGPLALPDGTLPLPLFQYWGLFGGSAQLKLWGDTSADGSLSQAEIGAITPVTRAELKNVRQITITTETLADDKSHSAASRQASSTRFTTTLQPADIGINKANLNACGDPPDSPLNLLAADTPDDGGSSITLTFAASFDDYSGEKDVAQYSIYRRRVGQPTFGAPIYNMKATGATTYTFVNSEFNSKRAEDAPEDAVQYEYFVTAWDCEPQESNPSVIAGPVMSVPNGPVPPVITAAFDTPCDEGGDVTLSFAASPADVVSQTHFEGYRVYRGTKVGLTAYKVRVLDVAPLNIPMYTVHDLNTSLLPMSPDSTYYYVVRAVRTGVESVDSNQWGPVYESDGLGRPVLQSVEDMPGDFGTRLKLAWDASPSESCPIPKNVTAYDVQRKSEYESAWSTVHTRLTLNHGPYAFNDTLCLPNVLYSYQVVARGVSGPPANSNVKSGRANAENQLVPPGAVLAQDQACDPLGAIQVTWNASPNDARGEMTHYRVYRGTQSGVYDYELPMVSAHNVPTYAVVDDQSMSGANAPRLGVTYYYVVRSLNDYLHLQSIASNESNVLAESTPTSPLITSANDTPNDGGRSITVRFNASAQDGICDNSVTGYKLYRGTSPGAISIWVGSVSPMHLASYTFVDDLVYSYDAPQDGVPYYYAVRAFAAELVSKLSNVQGPVSSVRDGAASRIVFADNFEVASGWTHGASSGTDDWQTGTPLGHVGSYGYPDPTTCPSGTKIWGNALTTGTGTYSRSAKTWFMSPMIDCRNRTNVMLTFKRWLNVEQPSRDQAEIEVRVASGSWTRVWRNPSQITDNSWSDFQLDIRTIADGRQNVQVRFLMTSNASREYTGWNIDDFSLVEQ